MSNTRDRCRVGRMRRMADNLPAVIAFAQASETPQVFGVDIFGWAVIAGIAAVVAVIATIAMPFITDAILTRRDVVVTFGDPGYGHQEFTVDVFNQGRGWIRIDSAAQLRVWDARSGTLVVIHGDVGPIHIPFGGTFHTGDGDSTEFDGRSVAARLSEMGYTGTQQVYGEYVGHDKKVYRTQTPHPINVEEWAPLAEP